MTEATKTALRLSRIVNADPQTAFEAWTQPEQIRNWACPEGLTVLDSQVDLTVGGSYVLQMGDPEGGTHTAIGTYREIDPPRRLVYTWDWIEDEHRMDLETVVTVEFHSRDGGTEVVLTHEAFPNTEATDAHDEGWSSCLDKFAGHLTAAADSERQAAMGA